LSIEDESPDPLDGEDLGGHLNALDDWKRAIGEFMVAFNECEHFIYRMVDLLYSPGAADLIGKERLLKRSQFVEAAIRDGQFSVDLVESSSAFKALKDLADFRNILAHNAPMLTVYFAGDEVDRALIELRSRGGKGASLDEIGGKTGEARALSRRLMQVFEALHKQDQQGRT